MISVFSTQLTSSGLERKEQKLNCGRFNVKLVEFVNSWQKTAPWYQLTKSFCQHESVYDRSFGCQSLLLELKLGWSPIYFCNRPIWFPLECPIDHVWQAGAYLLSLTLCTPSIDIILCRLQRSYGLHLMYYCFQSFSLQPLSQIANAPEDCSAIFHSVRHKIGSVDP